ncbi:conserved hypothetical protein, membrane [Beggiatoa sp. PS]|nr:conserved hypothetical protein, membrane [Beggiatoa sp. PS]
MNQNAQQISKKPAHCLAIVAESLYLLNLLVLPGIAFLILMVLYFKYENSSSPIVGCHLRQSFSATIWAGLVLMLVIWVIFEIGGYDTPYTWLIAIIYFIIFHNILVFLGIFGLIKAIAGEQFHYPIIGPSS